MMDMMASFPFDGEHDQDLAVAYTGVFFFLFYVSSAWFLLVYY